MEKNHYLTSSIQIQSDGLSALYMIFKIFSASGQRWVGLSMEETLPYQVMENKNLTSANTNQKSFEGGDFISFQKEFI